MSSFSVLRLHKKSERQLKNKKSLNDDPRFTILKQREREREINNKKRQGSISTLVPPANIA